MSTTAGLAYVDFANTLSSTAIVIGLFSPIYATEGCFSHEHLQGRQGVFQSTPELFIFKFESQHTKSLQFLILLFTRV